MSQHSANRYQSWKILLQWKKNLIPVEIPYSPKVKLLTHLYTTLWNQAIGIGNSSRSKRRISRSEEDYCKNLIIYESFCNFCTWKYNTIQYNLWGGSSGRTYRPLNIDFNKSGILNTPYGLDHTCLIAKWSLNLMMKLLVEPCLVWLYNEMTQLQPFSLFT